jgi:hypothetical protein
MPRWIIYFSFVVFSHLPLEGKSNLLMEPIHLPDMVHVQVDPSRFAFLIFFSNSFSPPPSSHSPSADTQETRFFYATGEKNPNLNKHIENAFKSHTIDSQELHVQSSVASTIKPRTKPRSILFPRHFPSLSGEASITSLTLHQKNLAQNQNQLQ